MGFTEVLTIVFIVLKLIGVINWSWWLVLLPELIAVALYIVIVVIEVCLRTSISREIKRIGKQKRI